MKKLFLALTLLSAAQMCFSQAVSDRHVQAQLTSTCSNATTTCDTAGVTVFGVYGDVLGPQTVEMNTQGYGLAQITAHGTYTGTMLNFEFSDDGGINWYPQVCTRSDINVQESSEVVASNATVPWECGVGAATKFRVRQSALSTGGPVVGMTLTSGIIEPAPTVSISSTVGSTDPCQNPAVLKSSAKIQVTGTTAVVLVPLSAGKITYVCGWDATIQGSATTVGTVQLESGTQTTNPCDTGTTTLTGVYKGNITASVPTVVGRSGSGTIMATTAGQQFCAISTGTTIDVQGTLTFVQQ